MKEKLHDRVYDSLLGKISDKTYVPGAKIPTEYELMEEYGVSRNTVIHAVKRLESEHFIERKRKSGTFVCKNIAAGKEMRVIPMILPYDSNLNADVYEGAQEYALSHGCVITFYNSFYSNKTERDILKKLLGTNPECLIIYPCSMYSNIDILSEYNIRGIPILFLDRKLPGIEGALITANNEAGERELVTQLIGMGHRRIAFYLIHDNMLETEQQRFFGYCNALIRHSIPLNYNYIIRCNVDIRHRHVLAAQQNQVNVVMDVINQAVEKLLALEERPTVICCINDESAFMMIRALNEHGVRVPQDISVAGFDNLVTAATHTPSLTTVQQNFLAIGKNAVQNMLYMLENKTILNTVTDTKIFLRNSTAAI